MVVVAAEAEMVVAMEESVNVTIVVAEAAEMAENVAAATAALRATRPRTIPTALFLK